MRGLPAIDYSNINGECLLSCVGLNQPTILEVGCNDGQSTMWFLEIFTTPTVYCFEPDPRAVKRFKDRVGMSPGVTLLEMAVSDHEGVVDFYQSDGKRDDEWLAKALPEGWDLSGSIKQPHRHLKVHPLVTFDRKIQVPTTTLDKVRAEHGIELIDLIWMDVQGAELEVFTGAQETLARTRFLYTEYSDRELYKGQVGLRKLLDHLPGFSVVIRYPGDALLRNDRLMDA